MIKDLKLLGLKTSTYEHYFSFSFNDNHQNKQRLVRVKIDNDLSE